MFVVAVATHAPVMWALAHLASLHHFSSHIFILYVKETSFPPQSKKLHTTCLSSLMEITSKIINVQQALNVVLKGIKRNK